MKALFTAIVLSTTLAASGASAQGSNLSGRWQCMAQCLGPPGGFAFITQNGWDLNIVNDAGMASRAWEDYPGHIWVEGVQMGALYSPDGFTLQFTNGTIWQRAPILPPPGGPRPPRSPSRRSSRGRQLFGDDGSRRCRRRRRRWRDHERQPRVPD